MGPTCCDKANKKDVNSPTSLDHFCLLLRLDAPLSQL